MLSQAKSRNKGQRIIPHLWFDKEAVAAAKFYTSIFPKSHLTNITTMHNTPSGDADLVSFDLNGFQLMAISGGPVFTLNPSISFMLNFDPGKVAQAEDNLDKLWQRLSQGGKVLMPLQEYPFSKKYGWLEDKFGVSWQLILTNPTGEERPFIVPSLLFVGEQYGKAEAAVNYYVSVFKTAKLGQRLKYPAHAEPNQEGTVMFSDFQLFETWFTAMDGGGEHKFQFNEAASFIVKCETQKEIDDYWHELSAVPDSEQCGWLKDKFGVSWQIVPKVMDQIMSQGTPKQIDQVIQALLPMKKIDISQLVKAYGEE